MTQNNFPELPEPFMPLDNMPHLRSEWEKQMRAYAHAALSSQGAGEAVAWMHQAGHVQVRCSHWDAKTVASYTAEKGWTPLFTRPQAARPTDLREASKLADWLNSLAAPEAWWTKLNDAATMLRHQASEIEGLRSLKAAQPARVVEALRDAIERMDRARMILTDGQPRPDCNWGMLNTADLVGWISTPPAAPTPLQQAGCDYCTHPLYAGTKCQNCGRESQQAAEVTELENPAVVALAKLNKALDDETGLVPKRDDVMDDHFASGLRGGLRIAIAEIELALAAFEAKKAGGV